MSILTINHYVEEGGVLEKDPSFSRCATLLRRSVKEVVPVLGQVHVFREFFRGYYCKKESFLSFVSGFMRTTIDKKIELWYNIKQFYAEK